MTKLITFSLAVSDDDARNSALDVHTSCIVEAPAGSGKTGLLVQRFLKLLGDDTVAQPEEVLAMTFTRKATAEMLERVLEQLQAAHDSAPLQDPGSSFEQQTRTFALAVLERSKTLSWNLLAQPQRLNIRSILSVCMNLANAQPLVSGNGGVQQPVETPQPLYRTAAQRTLMQLGGSDVALHQALSDVLLHRDGSLSNCEALIAAMLHTREQWAELIPLDRNLDDHALDTIVRPRLERSLEQIVCHALTQALEAMPAGLLEELTQLAARLGTVPGYKGGDSPIALCAGLLQPPSAVAEHLDHWRALIFLLLKPSDGDWRAGFAVNHLRFEIAKPDAAYLKQLVQSIQNDRLHTALSTVLALPPARYPDEQWRVAKSLFRVLRHALAELKLLFSERGECDFNELALCARAALRSGEGVSDLALAAGGTLRHMLVDEMQDTSSAQYDLIELLTRSWDGRSQTLFLVGDPKQSIYLFRQARVERFLRTMREARIGDIELQPLHLTANFRSQANLVADFNTTFDRIFPTPENLTAATGVPFIPAESKRSATAQTGITWHPHLLDPNAPIDYAAQEAAEIRNIVEARLTMPLPSGRTKPWSIAILARARKHLDAIVTEFKAHDGKPEIPFRAVDLDPLGERIEVLDALAITRALLHPADRIAWLAVFRAPWCGLGRNDLLILTGEGPEADTTATVAHLIAARRHLLSAEAQHLLDRAWPVLETAVATLGRTSLAIHIERTWRSLGGDAPLTPEQLTNVLRFFELLSELETEAAGINLTLLTDRLDNLFAASNDGGANIELLTMHSAKGLEWDLVLVPGLHRRPRGSTGTLLNWMELDAIAPGHEPSIILAPIWGRGEDSDQLNKWLRSIRSARERAEEKRLFYVAATRAREELHLFAAASRNAKGELAQPATASLLSACWPAAHPVFAKLVDTTSPSTTNLLEMPTSNPTQSPTGFEQTFAIAAGAELTTPTIQRLPPDFNPTLRFQQSSRLNYTPASILHRAATFDRPEGGFTARGFGNVVHRYLQLIANHLATGIDANTLLTDLLNWTPRLTASLRAEGLAPTAAKREADRALEALTRTLTDPTGRWIIAPHTAATSEQSLATPQGSLRADRTFLGGATPNSTGNDHIWIIDFKTTEQGSRTDASFEAAEKQKYSAQLEAYATLRRTLSDGHLPIHLALYYPLVPKLIHWHSDPPQ